MFRSSRLLITFLSASLLPVGASLAQDHDHGGGQGSGPSAGLYAGYLETRDGRRLLLSSMDLYVVQEGDGYRAMRATIKIPVGDHASLEYVASDYPEVDYSYDTLRLSLDSDHADLLFTDLRFDSGKVTGRFRSASSGIDGEARLFHVMAGGHLHGATPEDLHKMRSHVPALRGIYRGTCGEQLTVLQIETIRLHASDGAGGSPFQPYLIRGRAADTSLTDILAPVGGSGQTVYSVIRYFDAGEFDPYTGRLRLVGVPGDAECMVDRQGMHCQFADESGASHCMFERDAAPLASRLVPLRRLVGREGDDPHDGHDHSGGGDEPGDDEPTDPDEPGEPGHPGHPTDPDEPADPGEPTDPEGEPLPDFPPQADVTGRYRGYLHHEALGRSQALEVDVRAYLASWNPHNLDRLYVSAAATLFLGAHGSPERIAFRFETRPFAHTFPNFAFSGEQDPILRITSWTVGAIAGEWYSRDFGRVGTFQLLRDGVASVPQGAAAQPSLGGRYQGKGTAAAGLAVTRILQLGVSANGGWHSDDPLSEALRFTGYHQIPGVTQRVRIEEGALDIHTGAVALKDEAGRWITGSLLDGGALELSWPTVDQLGARWTQQVLELGK